MNIAEPYTLPLHSIGTSIYGVQAILGFYNYAKGLQSTSLDFDISSKIKVDANLSALIYAICYKLKIENDVSVNLVYNANQNIFERNGLVSHLQGYGNDNQYVDNRHSAIALTTFDKLDEDEFCGYLRNEFFGHRGTAQIDKVTKDALRDQYVEIFSNVEIHTNTDHPVFACGQYFPHNGILKFSLVDLGCGFLQPIQKFTEGQINDDKSALVWATSDINTTKELWNMICSFLCKEQWLA
jgi:hypothetical protein